MITQVLIPVKKIFQINSQNYILKQNEHKYYIMNAGEIYCKIIMRICDEIFTYNVEQLSCHNYLSSTVPPASSNFFFSSSASFLGNASLTTFGAPSTKSLASLRPRPVASRTTLIT